MKGEPVVQDERISFEWEFSGTNTGATGRTARRPPARRSIRRRLDLRNQERQDRSHQADYYDALGFYKQLGLM